MIYILATQMALSLLIMSVFALSPAAPTKAEREAEDEAQEEYERSGF